MRRILIITASLALCATFTADLRAADYLGEFCWQVEPNTAELRLAFTHMGDGYFLITGRLIETVPVGENLISGTAAMVGNELHMHLTSSGIYTQDNAAALTTVVLDTNTLDGYAEAVGVYATRSSGTSGTSYDGTMTLTFTSCP